MSLDKLLLDYDVAVRADERNPDRYTAADVREAHAAVVSFFSETVKWVPVSEPPTKTGSYLVWIGPRETKLGTLRGRVQIERYTAVDGAPADYFGDVGWKTLSFELPLQTHWMPLPEAPK